MIGSLTDVQLNLMATFGSALPLASNATDSGLIMAVGFALLGGALLNLMPCLLPVLSLKALTLLEGRASAQGMRRPAIWYTSGVLSTFSIVGGGILVFRAAGANAGWAFQLQRPVFVSLLALLVVAIGLSLAGVFTLSSNVGEQGQRLLARRDNWGDFFTGALACVVASPCIAPFHGAGPGLRLCRA